MIAMTLVPNSRALSSRTILISPNQTQSKLTTKLRRYGARVLAWPTLDIGEPENYQSLDEAIENLFGYDWLIFQNEDAVDFFLNRFQTLAHDIAELDALRVCAVGEGTVHKLEESQVHIDIIHELPSSPTLFEAIKTHVGGREAMQGLNFLVPSAAMARDGLQQLLEEVGARIDSVTAFRTVAHSDANLAQLNALLAGGGIDCIVFNSSGDVLSFARLFGSSDLAQLLAEAEVACADSSASRAAGDFGLQVDLTIADPEELAETVCRHLSS
jgi:uroporphyrinogen III methyltransferase/synthase